jgi:rpsU-divergently transcribed protein
LNAGGRDLEISSDQVSLLVPEGPIGLVYHFIKQSNLSLSSHPIVREQLQMNEEDTRNSSSSSISEIKIQTLPEKLEIVSRARLEMILPYVEQGHWLNAMALSALPEHAEATTRLALETVDEIWHVAGDRSVDYNWYIRRAGFMPGYYATELYLLSDESNEYEETWKFLNWHVHSLFGTSDTNSNSSSSSSSNSDKTADEAMHATMLDTLEVASKGAFSFASSLASMSSDMLKETSTHIQERKRMNDKKGY